MSRRDQWRLFPPTRNYRSQVVVLRLTLGKDSHGIVQLLHDLFCREGHVGPHDLAEPVGPELGGGGGGDGTINEIVNGVLSADTSPQMALGVLPLGTANDFARGCFRAAAR